MQQEYLAKGKVERFDHLKNTLLGRAQALPYASIAAAMDMTEAAARKAAQRIRQRYRSVLREHIADNVDDPARVEEEIRDLFAALAY